MLGARVRRILAAEQLPSRTGRRTRLLAGALSLWLFAQIAPALSVGVDIARPTARPALPASRILPAATPVHAAPRPRGVRSGKPLRPAELPQTVARLAQPLPDLGQGTLPSVRYTDRREPKFESLTEAETTETAPPSFDEPPPSRPHRRLKAPSPAAVALIGAAIGFGLGHIHDHDKD